MIIQDEIVSWLHFDNRPCITDSEYQSIKLRECTVNIVIDMIIVAYWGIRSRYLCVWISIFRWVPH